jgi:hypothetical protein
MGKIMHEEIQKIETPQWMLNLFKAIDALDFSENAGFSLFTEDIDLVFGSKHVTGIDNVKAFFKKLDEPYSTVHHVKAVFKTGSTYLMQGSAELQSNTDKNAEPIFVEPLFNLLYLNDKGKVTNYVVSAPPEAIKAVLG